MKIEEGITPIYAKERGAERCRSLSCWKRETWMLADKAVELGFADEVSETPETKQDESVPECDRL